MTEMPLSFSNLLNACGDAGLSEDQIRRVLNDPDECRKVAATITRRSTALQKKMEAHREYAERQAKIRQAKEGTPPSVEDLQAVNARLVGWIDFRNNNTALTTALRNSLHLRPEIYADFSSQQLAFFQMYIVLGYDDSGEIAELLDFECDLAPTDGDVYPGGRPKRLEWKHVKGYEAGEMVWDLLNAMREQLAETVVHIYQQEREQLLARQREEAISRGFPKPISEMTTGLPKGLLECFAAMDVQFLTELEKVGPYRILKESRRNNRRVAEGTIRKLRDFLSQHNLSLKSDDLPSV